MPNPRFNPPQKMPIPVNLPAAESDAVAAARGPFVAKSQPAAVRAHWEYIGGLSNPSKMPCYSFSIPARTCPIGGRLVATPGSVCSGCYVLSASNYRRFNVKRALWRRYLYLNRPDWSAHFAETVRYHNSNGWFRFHDSGDLLGLWHIERIVNVAERLPTVRFWLPTREYQTIRDWLQLVGPFPKNLTVRTSAHMVDQPAQKIGNLPMSTVYTQKPIGRQCIAYTQNGECRDCRLCWDKRIRRVSYPQH